VTPLRVLVACEYSGVVRRAFLARGCDAWSCDLLPSEDGSNRHICGDARDLLHDGWDLLMVARLRLALQRRCVILFIRMNTFAIWRLPRGMNAMQKSELQLLQLLDCNYCNYCN
jgi:hypothetical protein